MTAIAATAALGAAAPARAATPPRVATTSPAACEAAPVSQPFARWGDRDAYRLVSGGGFSDGAPGWTLTGGARIAAESDGYDLAGATSATSLVLPAGASAQSPFSCVDDSQPTFRFMYSGAALGTGLLVTVVYETPAGQTVTAPAGTLRAPLSWAPSRILQTGAEIASQPSGGTARMALRFTTAVGTAKIDDVFIDPRMHGP